MATLREIVEGQRTGPHDEAGPYACGYTQGWEEFGAILLRLGILDAEVREMRDGDVIDMGIDVPDDVPVRVVVGEVTDAEA